MRFDWYTATTDDIRGPDMVGELMDVFGQLDHAGIAAEGHRKVYRYDNATAIKDAAGQLCIVRWGGNGGGTNVEANGPSAGPVSAFLRAAYPNHRVTRMDACIDREAPGLFDRYHPQLLGIADDHRIVVDHQGDWHRGERGRTLYLGGKDSEKRLRFYEKGIQLHGERHPQASPDLCRLEAVIRPDQRDAKHRAATMTPLECFGSSAWLTESLERYAGIGAPEVQLRTHRKTQLDRAFEFMCKQYRRPLEAKLAASGGDAFAFVGMVMDEFKRQDEERALLRRAA